MLGNMNIGKKLLIGFFTIVVAFIIFAIFEIIEIDKLGTLQDNSAKRGEDAVVIAENQKKLGEVYAVAADAVINGYSEETKKEFALTKKEFYENLQTIKDIMDTPEEKKWAEEYEKSLKLYLDTIENDLFLQLAQKSSNIDKDIQNTDGKIDKARGDAIKNLELISKSLKEEMKEEDEIFDNSRKFIFVVTAISGIFIGILSTIIALTLSRNIVNSAVSLKTIASELASGNGDLTKRLQVLNKDELGDASEEVNHFIEKTQLIISEAKMTANENASIAEELSATSRQVGSRVEDSTKIVSDVSSKVKVIVDDIRLSAQTTSSVKNEVSKADEMLNVSKNEISSMVEQISRSVEVEIEFADRLNQLSSNAEQVKGVLSVIGDIADQTNLLALNAAIEAARAGEHGRGFAVVADEVRKLAERTQKSLLETNSTISTIVQAINDASSQMEKNAESIKQLGDSSQKVGNHIEESSKIVSSTYNAVDELSKTVTEISVNADNIGSEITKIDNISLDNARSVEEISTAIDHLSAKTEQLEKMLSQFRT